MNLNSIFGRKPPQTGLVLDSYGAISSVPKHEDLLLGGGPRKPWRELMPRFRDQGPSWWCTAFAGSSIASAFEKGENGVAIDLSPRELFYRSGGGVGGNSLFSTARAMQEAVVTEEAVPTPVPKRWDAQEWQAQSVGASVKDLSPFAKYRVKSSATVSTDDTSMRNALAVSPIYAAIGVGRGYLSEISPIPPSISSYHAVVITDILEDGTRIVFDSLPSFAKTDGFHALAPGYPVVYGLTFVDAENPPPPPKDDPYYGKRRDLDLERKVAEDLAKRLSKSPGLRGVAGRNWFMYVNAVAYGSFGVQDVINDMAKRVRDGRGIFDFSVARFRQAKWW